MYPFININCDECNNSLPCNCKNSCGDPMLSTNLVGYQGPPLDCTDIKNCDSLSVALQKIDIAICNTTPETTTTTSTSTTQFLQDLQSVLNEGSYAELDGANSAINILTGDVNNRIFDIYVNNGANETSGLDMSNEWNYLYGNSVIGNRRSQIGIELNGQVYLQQKDYNNNLLKTRILINTPVSDTVLSFPAKTIAGDYTIATLDDIPSSLASSLDQVLNVGNTSATPIVQAFGGQTATTDYEGIRITQNNFSGSTYLSKDGFVSSRNTGEYVRLQLGFGLELKTGTNNGHAKLKSDLLSDNKTITFQFPNKLDGTYTLATTADLRPYKVYSALLSQSGTNDPTAVVLENTLGGTIIWTRTGVGYYLATLTGAFPNAQKVGIPGISPSSQARILAYHNNIDSIEFYSSDYNNVPSDIGFFGQMVEIRVYN